MMSQPDHPLCVDLDGTLIRTDLLHEALLQIARQHPLQLPSLVPALLAGKAAFKDRVRQLASVDGALLPYRTDVVSMVETARSEGRETVLCTASPAEFAGAVANHLGLFSTVLTSSREVNLAAVDKAQALTQRYGHGQFDYVGNTDHDLAVFAECRNGVLVSSNSRLREQSLAINPNMTFVDDAGPRIKTWLKAIRVHQWVKNLLIFVPLVAGHAAGNPPQLLAAILAFFAFCLCASGTYIVNDLLDLAADRKHHSKKRRPFASGAIPVSQGIFAASLLILGSLLIATQLPTRFLLVLLAYFVATIAYSFALKRQVIVDVIVLAGLYSLRIIAGAAATSIAPSFWLLGFSMFIFLCLAIVKRVSELQRTIAAGQLAGRGYIAEDRYVLISLGTASGLVSVLILALYMQSETATDLYPVKEWLWLVPAAMLYWVARLWLKTTRDQIHDDPIVFATRDWQSLVVLGVIAGLFALATWGPAIW